MDTRDKILALFDRLTEARQEAFYEVLLEHRGLTPTDEDRPAPPTESTPHD